MKRGLPLITRRLTTGILAGLMLAGASMAAASASPLPGAPAHGRAGVQTASLVIKTTTASATPTSQSNSVVNGVDQVTEHWTWSIPAGRVLIVPAIHGPSDAPYVLGGTTKGKLKVATISLQASKGARYWQFSAPSLVKDPNDSGWFNMTGWPAGTKTYNNIWPPAYVSATVNLTVTFTNSRNDAAAIKPSHCSPRPRWLFPWVRQRSVC